MNSEEKEGSFNKYSKMKNYAILNELGHKIYNGLEKNFIVVKPKRWYNWCYWEKLEVKGYDEAMKWMQWEGHSMVKKNSFLVRKSGFKFKFSLGYWLWPLQPSIFSSLKWREY